MRRYPNTANDLTNRPKETPFTKMMKSRKSNSQGDGTSLPDINSLKGAKNSSYNKVGNDFTNSSYKSISQEGATTSSRGGGGAVDPHDARKISPQHSAADSKREIAGRRGSSSPFSSDNVVRGAVTEASGTANEKPEYIITSETPRKELLSIIEKQQEDIRRRTDSVNAVQRNFIRLSEMYKKDSERWQRMEQEFQALKENEKKDNSSQLVMSALKEELQSLLSENDRLKNESQDKLNDLSMEVLNLQREVQEIKMEREVLEREVQVLRSSETVLKSEICEWKQKREATAGELKASEEKVDHIRGELERYSLTLKRQLDSVERDILCSTPLGEISYGRNNTDNNLNDLIERRLPSITKAFSSKLAENALARSDQSKETTVLRKNLSEAFFRSCNSLAQHESKSRQLLEFTCLQYLVDFSYLFHSLAATATRMEQKANQQRQVLVNKDEQDDQIRRSYEKKQKKLESDLLEAREMKVSAEEALDEAQKECQLRTVELQRAIQELRENRTSHELAIQELQEKLLKAQEIDKNNALESVSEGFKSKIKSLEQLYKSEQQQNEILRRQLSVSTEKIAQLERNYEERLTVAESQLSAVKHSFSNSSQLTFAVAQLCEKEMTVRHHFLREEELSRAHILHYLDKYLLQAKFRSSNAHLTTAFTDLLSAENVERQKLMLQGLSEPLAAFIEMSRALQNDSLESEKRKWLKSAASEKEARECDLLKQLSIAREKLLESQAEVTEVAKRLNESQNAIEEVKKQNSERDKAAVTALHKLMAAEEASKNAYSCPACFQLYKNPVTCVPCGHTYCKTCLYNHPKNKKKFPQGVSNGDTLFCAECGSFSAQVAVTVKVLEDLGGVFGYKGQVLNEILSTLERKRSAIDSKRTSIT